MKQYRPILSIVLAMLVLLSSSSFIVGLHRCRGEIKSIALFSKAEACDMEKQIPPCHKPSSTPCCEDEALLHSGEEFQASIADLSLSPVLEFDIITPHVLIAEIIPVAPDSPAHFYNYDPPLRATDLTVSLQVFLI